MGGERGKNGWQLCKISTQLRSSSLWFCWHFSGGLIPPIRLLFHRPRRLTSYLHSILATCFIIPHTTASFLKQLCVYMCVCIVLIYILTWYKSTLLSAIIITHLVKGSTQFFLHLRRAAAGATLRRPANTPPALPGIQTASACTQSHCLPWCNGAFLLDSKWRENANASTGKCVSMYCRNKAVRTGWTGNKDSRGLFYVCQWVKTTHA